MDAKLATTEIRMKNWLATISDLFFASMKSLKGEIHFHLYTKARILAEYNRGLFW